MQRYQITIRRISCPHCEHKKINKINGRIDKSSIYIIKINYLRT